MKRCFIFFLTLLTFANTPNVAFADVSGLTPCKDSAVFKRRLDGSVKKLTSQILVQSRRSTNPKILLE